MTLKILAMGGDGIGPEVVEAALKVLDVAAASINLKVDVSEDLLHGAAWEKYGTFIRPDTLAKARESDALLVGAVGGPQWDHIQIDGGPAEQDGLMKLRKELDVFACIRSAKAWDALIPKTPYRPERVRGADVIVMRELCGGAMFSDTRGIEVDESGRRRGFDLNEYSESEIERFARVSFEVARRRKRRVVSVDKSNVFVADKLWREVVSEVILEGHRAIGIETVDGEQIRASREVILCQGAFGTPQTLMLSGIGPADHLYTHGIGTVVDLPAVGRNLEDHVDVSIQYGSDRMDLSLARYQRLDKAALLMARWLLGGKGPGAGAFFSTVLFHGLEGSAVPEFETYMTPMIIDENITAGTEESTPLLQRLGRKLLVRGRKVAMPGVQIDINLERPRSSGTVRLASADPLNPPLIDPHYFTKPKDLDELVQGVKAVREIMRQPAIRQYLTGELGAWKNVHSDADIINAIRATAYTGHHPSSTARMGADDDSVLDEKLRVRGIDNLRVCDASAMPSQITGNLNATVIAMAEKAADLILGEQASPAQDPRVQQSEANGNAERIAV